MPDNPIPGIKGDIYIDKEAALRAMHGDRVAARITKLDRDGRAHGEIVEVVRHAHLSVVGEFRIRRRGNYVVPHDDRIRQWILIPEDAAIPPAYATVNRVGAKPVPVENIEDLKGFIVNAEIIDFGEEGDRPVAGSPRSWGSPTISASTSRF